MLEYFCNFATGFGFQKRKTFWKEKAEKLSKTENFTIQRQMKKQL